MTPLPPESNRNFAEPTEISSEAWQTVDNIDWYVPREGPETVPVALHWSIGNATVLLQSYGEDSRRTHTLVHIDHEANQATGIPRANVYSFWPKERQWFLQRDIELPARDFTGPSQPSSQDIQKLDDILGALRDYQSQFTRLEDPEAEWRASVGALYDNCCKLWEQYVRCMHSIGHSMLELYAAPMRAYLTAAEKLV